eukprot:5883163-Pleurochrysis_carterae.AAC.2
MRKWSTGEAARCERNLWWHVVWCHAAPHSRSECTRSQLAQRGAQPAAHEVGQSRTRMVLLVPPRGPRATPRCYARRCVARVVRLRRRIRCGTELLVYVAWPELARGLHFFRRLAREPGTEHPWNSWRCAGARSRQGPKAARRWWRERRFDRRGRRDRDTGHPGRSQARTCGPRQMTNRAGLLLLHRRNRRHHMDEMDGLGPMTCRFVVRRMHPRSAPRGS